MIFNSFQFLLFLPAIWVLHYFLSDRLRWLLLVIASLVFYAGLKVPYLLLVISFVTVATYSFGLWIHKAETTTRKKQLLWIGIAINVLVLIVLKYLPFLADNLSVVFNVEFVAPILVSIGVSYYVFQAISYLADIYLEIEEPEKHLGHFFLYLNFFPKLLQGPIERAGDLLPQIKAPYRFDYETTRSGLVLFAWGLFLKVVIADRLGVYVDDIYDHLSRYSGAPLLLASYAYAFQIYADFAGYTAMAIGVGRLFGFQLSQNFNSPYHATSVADFWRRWHMTFSRWILDYIFKPLQMSWRSWREAGTALALLVTFLVSGVWHGAAWTFIVWGLLHGVYMAASVYWKPLERRWLKRMGLNKTFAFKIWQIAITFHLVTFAWIFFRAASLADAWYVVTHLTATARRGGWLFGNPGMKVFLEGDASFDVPIVLCALGVLAAVSYFKGRNPLLDWNLPVRWVTYVLLTLSIIWFGVLTDNKFIYFQF